MEAPAPTIQFEDAVLVRQIQAGDVQSFAHLVAKYQDKVFNAAWRVCGNLDDARDVTQEAFLKALESIGSFRGRSGFYTWIFRIAMNLALTHRRKSARAPTLSLDGPDGHGRAPALRMGQSASPNPAARTDSAEIRAHVADALQNLDEDHRAVVVLRDMEGFDYAEIADILEIPRGTVKSRLARGREALRQALAPLVSHGE